MIRIRIFVGVCLFGLVVWSGCAPIDDPPKNFSNIQVGNGGPPLPIVVPDALQERVKAAVEQVRNRELLTTHSFWTVIHGILGNGLKATLRDPFTNQHINAVEYMCKGGTVRGMEFIVVENVLDGKDGINVRIGPVFDGQGHQDQFVCEMAQLGMPIDQVFEIKHKSKIKKYTFEDFLRHTKANAQVKGDQELSWTVLALSQYYGTNLSWTNMHGDKLHFEDLMRYEVNQRVETAACGGTHRLFGLTWAYYLHLRDGGKETKVWKDVGVHLKKYKEMARDFQNPDGSFSTEYFRSRGFNNELDKRIGSTGHIVEWLALYLSDEELREPWMQKAVQALVQMIFDGQNQLLDAGGLYHAAHGLHLYAYRVWGEADAHPEAKVIPLPPKKK